MNMHEMEIADIGIIIAKMHHHQITNARNMLSNPQKTNRKRKLGRKQRHEQQHIRHCLDPRASQQKINECRGDKRGRLLLNIDIQDIDVAGRRPDFECHEGEEGKAIVHGDYANVGPPQSQ